MTTQNSELKTQRSPQRCCGGCVLATGIWNGRPEELVCASRVGHAGVLTRVEADGVCRCFRAKPTPPVRLEPPAPPNDEIRYIPLTRGLFAIVNAADYDWLSGFKWHATSGRKAYACFARKDKVIYMHRLIMNPPEGKFVDHVNGNSLDYRRCNLRNCTKAQNAWNRPAFGGTSRFKGVHRDKDGRWKAGIRVGGRQTFIGVFDDEVEAARAYDRKARELFGEFAYLNFPAGGRIVLLRGRGRFCIRSSVRTPPVEAALGAKFQVPGAKFQTNPNGGSTKSQRSPACNGEETAAPGGKSQIPSTKSQTNPACNAEGTAWVEAHPTNSHLKAQMGRGSVWAVWLLEKFDFGDCLEFRASDLGFPPAPLEGVGPGP
jgi:hypothetical protein